MKRKLIWVIPVLEELELKIMYLKSRSPGTAQRILKRILTRIKILKDFPDIGRPIIEYEKASTKAEYRLLLNLIPPADLKLKELIIDDFTFMYGFNDREVVILYLKHHRQEDYKYDQR